MAGDRHLARRLRGVPLGLILLFLGVVVASRGCRWHAQSGPGPLPSRPQGPALQTEGRLVAWFLDVGQGDAALVRTPGGRVLLVDGGRQAAGQTVVAALRRRGVTRVDWVIGTHPHEDHIGGLLDVLESIPVGQVWDSGYQYPSPVLVRYLTLIRDRGTAFSKVRPGTRIPLEPGTDLEFLGPPPGPVSEPEPDPNNHSVVLRLVHGRVRFLFTGDMEEAERERIYRSPEAAGLPAEVLKVAHHGSHNGTDGEFLRRVRPRYAIISSGGEYGHPHRETLEALRAAHVEVFRTDRLGTIGVSTDGSALQVEAERDAAAAYSSGGVIGNRNSRVYHSPGCPDLPSAPNRVAFPTPSAARAAGYRPHARCTS